MKIFWNKTHKFECDAEKFITRKKCVAGTKKHIAVPAILLTILTLNMADIT